MADTVTVHTVVCMDVRTLTRDDAVRYAADAAALLSLIPDVDYPAAAVLADVKRGVPLTGRWDHSVAAFDDRRLVGVLLTYERPPEPASSDTDQQTVFPVRSFYLDGLAVVADLRGRGIAKALLCAWLTSTASRGFTSSTGPVTWSLQTNAADWNAPVRKLYERRGFSKVGVKRYPDRTDVVMFRGLRACGQ